MTVVSVLTAMAGNISFLSPIQNHLAWTLCAHERLDKTEFQGPSGMNQMAHGDFRHDAKSRKGPQGAGFHLLFFLPLLASRTISSVNPAPTPTFMLTESTVLWAPNVYVQMANFECPQTCLELPCSSNQYPLKKCEKHYVSALNFLNWRRFLNSEFKNSKTFYKMPHFRKYLVVTF